MPKNYYRAEHIAGCSDYKYEKGICDGKWIRFQLSRLRVHQAEYAANKYSSLYDGTNRAPCNNWLRKFTNKTAKTNRGVITNL